MKNLVIIVHANVQQDLADCLRDLRQVRGFTFSHAEGHGSPVDDDPFLSARDRVVGYVPRIRVDVLLDDHDVDAVISAIGTADCGVAGQGVYWVLPAEKPGRF